uniref:Uncharacterized protein n=1 Tax=Arundo donax TaxID=35708 RepID=A0A0A9FIB8_ARUDO
MIGCSTELNTHAQR